ncbi:hypothetical protein B7R22_17250 [Subtercola boreus]|uniref:Uncharacterized protein n=1 Tax=Subtercola boreus TaxID=120213 RepID=A0A3E0VRB9_9MICO|nr:hypothetical protein [Subtercola boreus]RFA12175.1 hypothetical protein B7R22_17250 [Subtercola boreus]
MEQVIGGLITALLGGGAIVLVAVINKKRSPGDQVGQLWDRLDQLEVRELVRDDYIMSLRQHIVDGKPPPPPPYPEELKHKDRNRDAS